MSANVGMGSAQHCLPPLQSCFPALPPWNSPGSGPQLRNLVHPDLWGRGSFPKIDPTLPALTSSVKMASLPLSSMSSSSSLVVVLPAMGRRDSGPGPARQSGW